MADRRTHLLLTCLILSPLIWTAQGAHSGNQGSSSSMPRSRMSGTGTSPTGMPRSHNVRNTTPGSYSPRTGMSHNGRMTDGMMLFSTGRPRHTGSVAPSMGRKSTEATQTWHYMSLGSEPVSHYAVTPDSRKDDSTRNPFHYTTLSPAKGQSTASSRSRSSNQRYTTKTTGSGQSQKQRGMTTPKMASMMSTGMSRRGMSSRLMTMITSMSPGMAHSRMTRPN